MGIKLSNFARAQLASPPSGTAGLSFSVAAGKGALFPTLGAGEYFYGVFTNAGKTAYEVVKIEARSTDSFTIAAGGRGLDGTAAATWTTSDVFYYPLTKKSLEEVPFSTPVTAISGVTAAADKLPYFTSGTAASVADFTAFGRSLVDDANASAARTTLGLGTMATETATDYVAKSLVDAKGDVIAATADNTPARVAVGANGTVLTADSTASAGVSWQVTGFTTGDVKLTLKTAADTGWVLMNDGSIGSATSGATTRANADTEPLYTLLWTNVSDTYAPVAGGRGANAAADFAANKAMTLPKALGRALAVYGSGSGLSARVLGQTTGTETHTLTEAEMPSHTHTPTYNNITGVVGAGGSGLSGGASAAAAVNLTIGNTGGGGAHNNMQPTVFLNVMVKL